MHLSEAVRLDNQLTFFSRGNIVFRSIGPWPLLVDSGHHDSIDGKHFEVI